LESHGNTLQERRVQRKVIVITGASAGIGAALARRLGADGHALVLAARRETELKSAASSAASDALAVPADVTRRGDVERLRDHAIESFGRVDVWINNAGRGITRPVLELTDEDFDSMMLVNVKSALYGMQAIVPHFMERGDGHLINVSSFLGRVPVATHRSAYNAAKAALNALTANLRVDVHKTHPHVAISLVMPGMVRTEFAENALGSRGGGSVPWTSSAAPPMPAAAVQTAEQVADVIADVIANPVAEVYTNPASREMVIRYVEDVGAFEARMARG
jgi:NADP-dependent 3-hydroxy acid dehydrogenase YdfG